MIGLLQQDPLAFALAFSALLLSLSLHEWGHAYAAFRFGDPTARRLGRLTLNPLRHLDPLGTVLLLLVGFGWARPVPVNPGAFRRYRLGLFVVSVAGIAVNLALAVLFALCVRGLFALDPWGVVQTFRGEAQTATGVLALGLFYASSLNLVLAVFNLLPIPLWTVPRSCKASCPSPGSPSFGGWSSTPGSPSSSSSPCSGGPSRRCWPSPGGSSSACFSARMAPCAP